MRLDTLLDSPGRAGVGLAERPMPGLAGMDFAALEQRFMPWGADHGSLGGLSDDDHPQYHTDGRAMLWLQANDGAGSGIDSDLLDGLHAAAFALASHTHSAADITSGTLAVARGGTGLGSYTTGDVLYASSSSALSRLGIGSNGQILTVVSGFPAWAAAAAAGVTGSGTTGKLAQWNGASSLTDSRFQDAGSGRMNLLGTMTGGSSFSWVAFCQSDGTCQGYIGDTGTGASAGIELGTSGGTGRPLTIFTDVLNFDNETGSGTFVRGRWSSGGLMIGAQGTAARALEVRGASGAPAYTPQMRLTDSSGTTTFDVAVDAATGYVKLTPYGHIYYLDTLTSTQIQLYLQKNGTTQGVIGSSGHASPDFAVSAAIQNLDLFPASLSYGIRLWSFTRLIYNNTSTQYVQFNVDSAQNLLIDTSNTSATNDGIANRLGGLVNTWTETLTANVTDSYKAGLRIDPGFTAASALTVTRYNYLDLQNVSVAGSAAVTDACVFRFDAAFGTHKATLDGTIKGSPGTVDGWLKVNENGTIRYVPVYDSTTS